MVILHSDLLDTKLAYSMFLGSELCFGVYELCALGYVYCCYVEGCSEWLVIWEPYVQLLISSNVLVAMGNVGDSFIGRLDSFLRFVGQLKALYFQESGNDSGSVVSGLSWDDFYDFVMPLMESLYSVYFSESEGGYRLVGDDVFRRVMFEIVRFSIGLVILHEGWC